MIPVWRHLDINGGIIDSEKRAIFSKQIILEIEKIGLNSLGIVIIISLFVGAVVTIQKRLYQRRIFAKNRKDSRNFARLCIFHGYDFWILH